MACTYEYKGIKFGSREDVNLFVDNFYGNITEMFVHKASKNIQEGLEFLALQAESDFNKELIKAISRRIKIFDWADNISVTLNYLDPDVDAQIVPLKNALTKKISGFNLEINETRAHSLDLSTLLHELLHIVTVQSTRFAPDKILIDDLKQLHIQIVDFVGAQAAQDKKSDAAHYLLKTNALDNIDELLA